MKKMKKLLSILMAATMTLAMAAPAFADDGAITVKNATPGQTYTAYKIFDANPGDDDSNKDLIAYTASGDVKRWFDKQEGNPFAFNPIAGTDPAVYNVTVSGADETVIQFLSGLVDPEKHSFALDAPFTGIEGTFTDGNLTWNGLDYGYYLVTSTVGSAVSVTSTNKVVTILDKNQGPTWPDPKDPDDPGDNGKNIIGEDGGLTTTSSANYGDMVKFQIKFYATDYAATRKITEYVVYDKMAEGLELQKETVNVKVGDVDVSDTTLSLGSAEDEYSFKITIPWKDKEYSSPSAVTVTYEAKVTDKAIIAENGNENRAWFTYPTETDPDDPTPDPTPDPEPKSEERTTTTYVYALGIKKVDDSGNALAGATFNLKLGDKEIKVTEDTAGSGVYRYDESGNGSSDVVSSADGMILIKGLEAGEYTLTETAAPAGYNQLKASLTVEAKMAEKYETTYKYYYDADTGEYTTEIEGDEDGKPFVQVTKNEIPISSVVVINNRGALLPSTGGIGTTIFYAAGIILMAGAVFFVVRRKKA